MEKLMQYVWQHRLYSSDVMETNDGKRVRVIDAGWLNTDSGPDFFNAKVEIDGKMWAGNIEIHVRASDWFRHGHDKDKAYDSVILHVVDKDDSAVFRSNGERIPQLVLKCNPHFSESYNALVCAKVELPCAAAIPAIPSLYITEWISALAFERLHTKVERLRSYYESFCGSWEDICYVTIARNLGFGINNDAFERLARKTPLRLLHKHSDSLFQIEAFLFGQAGMLDPSQNTADNYYQQLCREYAFLANKFSLTPIEGHLWKLFRIRPQNFPHRRIAMLAQYIHNGFNLMSEILSAKDDKEMRQLFSVNLTGYWANHFSFGKPVDTETRALGSRSIDIVLINTVAPLLYARGEILNDYSLIDRAIALLESIKPENNSIVDAFKYAGIKCPDALTSQALIQLRREYCEAHKCLYCKIGHRLLRESATRE